jgi:NitT/TauT family transport system ATP-binding protein
MLRRGVKPQLNLPILPPCATIFWLYIHFYTHGGKMGDVIFKNFSKSFDEKAVFNNFNHTFEAEKINVILGLSGSGKTTLLNSLAGLLGYDGSIFAFGTEHKNICNCAVSYMFQEARLIPQKTVFANLDFALKNSIPNKIERTVEINLLLKRLGLGDAIFAYPNSLSGGMAQRVALARAFLNKSGLLLMDEPFKALDDKTKLTVFETFFELWQEAPRTTFYVTHDLNEVEFIKSSTHAVTVFDISAK